RRIGAGGTLDAPWGMALAPKHFGKVGGDLLVGNFGDGRINAFSLDGTFLGQLKDSSGGAIEVDGLWGIAFGKGRDKRSLFFASGPNDEAGGLIGVIRQTRGHGHAAAAAAASATHGAFGDSMRLTSSDLVSLLEDNG